MSKEEKPKKLRKPNIYTGTVTPMVASGGGAEVSRPRPSLAATPVAPPPTSTVTFDYTHVKKDLARIGLLAGGFIVVLVALSFFIN